MPSSLLFDVGVSTRVVLSKVVSTVIDGNGVYEVVDDASERLEEENAVNDGAPVIKLTGPSPWNVTDLGVPAFEGLRLAVNGVLEPLSDPIDETPFVLDACEALLDRL